MDDLDATDTRTRITNLLAWSHTRGIRIDPRLHIIPGTSADSSHSAGITVVSREAIPPDTTLVHIPSSAVLSTRSSPLAAHIPHDDALQSQQLGLALALHYELLRGAASPWAPYLASLPRAPVPIALFWGDRDAASYTGHANTNTGNGDINDKEKAEVDLRLQDGLAAAAWLAGTEVEREVLRTPVAEIRAYYIHTAQPLLARRAGAGTGAGTLGAFYHAYALVSSRAFIVDAYHGLAMVPIADAFNHDQENHVQLESDYDVCPQCGAVDECPHDADDDETDETDAEMEDADTDAGSASGNAADTDADSGTASTGIRGDGAAVDTGGNADVDADVDKGKWKLQHNHASATRARGAADTHLAVAGGSRGNTSATRADGAASSRARCGNGAAQFGGGDVDSGASSTSPSVRAGATSTTVDAFGRAPAASGSAIPILARPSATVVFAGDEDMEKGTGSLDVNNCNINAILMASAPPPSAPPDLESADGAPASPPGFAPAHTAAGAESSVADTENSPPPAPAGFTPSTDFDCDSRDASTSALPARATPTAAREHGSLFGEAPAASGARGAIRGPSGRAGVGAICNSEDEGGEKDEDINFNVMLSVPSRPTLESARVPGFALSPSVGADFNFVDNANAHTPQSALPGSVLGAHAANSSRGASDGNDDNDNVPMLMSMASASAGADFNFEDNAHFGSTLAAVGDAHAASYEEGDNDNASMLMSTTGADYKFEDDASTLGGAANNSRSASYETDDYDNGDAEMSTSTPESPSAAGPPTIPRTSSSFRRSFSYSSEDNASPIAADASPLNRPHTFPIARDGLHGGASYEMASTAWIPPAAEVLNTYGGALGNGALLAQYGFALAANERDAVVFTWADCVRAASSRARTGAEGRWATPGFQACAGVARAWAAAVPATLWDGSGLVYVDANAKRGGYGGREAAWQGRVNADGRICEGLWLFCVLASGICASLLGPDHRDIDYAPGSDVVAQLGELAGLQLALEGASYGGDDGWESDGMGGGLRLGDPAADPERRPSRRPDRVEAVGRVVRTVVDLCDSRRTQLIGHTDLAAALDATAPRWVCTRAAIEQRLGEVSLLDSAVAGWRAIEPGTEE